MKLPLKTITLIVITTWGGKFYSQGLNNLLSPIGKVGIGTISPQARLHVIGSVRIDSNLTVARNISSQLPEYICGVSEFPTGYKCGRISQFECNDGFGSVEVADYWRCAS